MKAAIEWYQKAAQKRHAGAQFQLAIFYLDGIGVAKNEADAFNWMLKAAKNDHTIAQVNTGLLYLIGKGIERNSTKGKFWLKLAAEQGSKQAKRHLANLEQQEYCTKEKSCGTVTRN